jgi:hypothetical protein
MERRIKIKLDEIEIYGTLNDTITSDKIWDSLPLESVGNLWGDEVYFRTDIKSALDNTSCLSVDLGDIAFWPPNNAICIFYGQTPASTPGEIKPASAVNIIGKITDDLSKLKKVNDDCEIYMSRIE